MATQQNAPEQKSRLRFRILLGALIAFLGLSYGLVVHAAVTSTALLDFSPFALVGLLGALIANSTGVGGGVVFVPAFSFLRETGVMEVSPAQTVGVSFAIQCFGMSTGAVTWLNHFRDRTGNAVPQTRLRLLGQAVLIVAPLSLISLWITQYVIQPDPRLAFLLFKLFSITLGLALFLQILIARQAQGERSHFIPADMIALALIGSLGGAATALFSVGVGELMALYLFLRRFPLDVCVASAVIVSAITVLGGTPYHLATGNLIFEILFFAAPGVMLGGFLARRLAHALGAFRLKLGAAAWIVASSIVLIAISS
ncbi:sulfite exporter TauE/SafE family protein [Hyphobacterium sp. CCMP332]|uniref:sulfite exporter TauE/SafE family protein n=1 Tax=Hyphobacterium sp. CCMP332 TaxID=2749086 RepID=UPI001650A8D3|nr:sulfite exporter TauE/SafE family protein [Hyphobacterium sp. CCMP332]QNL19672.1 sulfite exporter TauE/SafE family protein [Hyphobacterium sp. CCMP332]